MITSIKQKNQPPAEYGLEQNYPNPLRASAFNPTTSITYTLPQKGHVLLSVYNVLGQRLVTLVNRLQEAGSHSVVWNGKNEKGQTLASGIYLYKIEAESFAQTKKLVLTK
jgi:flagellar hook assembly protein FlgD